MKKPIRLLTGVLIGILLLTVACSIQKKNNLVEVKEIKDNWQFRDGDSETWMDALVPGCVHTDLMRNGIIEDPFYRLNEHDVQWIDKKEWVYETEFRVPNDLLKKERVVLEFGGLDTYADVYLNQEILLSADNMFRGWTVDVKKLLHVGKNTLRIRFHSPIRVGLDRYDNYPHVVESSGNDLAEIGEVPGGKRVSPHVRKAQSHFGWDWGPRLVTSGIWKPVVLKAWDRARIVDLQVVQDRLDDEVAEMRAIFEIEAGTDVQVELLVRVNGEEVASSPVRLNGSTAAYQVPFRIIGPRRWWTNGLGEAVLYRVEGILDTGSGRQSLEHMVGLRTLEVVREQDSSGISMYFKLNGHPVFMKGANWIPGDAFPDRMTHERYEHLVRSAAECNFNMLRVWGGGIYENDVFYELCDRYGILVWQDFMFACNMYPGHPGFLESVGEEAAGNIRRLRNHPSLALWCGNNEVLSAWWNWGWKQRIEQEDPEGAEAQWRAYRDLFLDVLPGAVKRLDPGRFYWASSPQSGDTIPEDLLRGDHHYWGVWWGKEPFENYHTRLARFMSEYGFQSFPELNTVKKYTVEGDRDIYSEVMRSHQRSSIGNETIETYLLRDYREPEDFESFLYLSQVLQAEGVKKAMEGHRIAMPFTMGSLFWQLNDCWPVASWSSIDYYGNWKALQYYSRKAFSEILVAPRNENGIVRIHVVSDRLEPTEASLMLELLDFRGEVLWEHLDTITVAPNASECPFEIPGKVLLEERDPGRVLLRTSLLSGDHVLSGNLFYFLPVRDLDLPQTNIIITIEPEREGILVGLTTDSLAKNVYLYLEEAEGFFSDNYFDLLPGEVKTVRLETGLKAGELNEKLKFMTIRETYQK